MIPASVEGQKNRPISNNESVCLRMRVQEADGQGDPGFDADPLKDMLKMFVDGARADAENGGDFRVAFAFTNPAGHFMFARRQTEGAGRRN
jgi:hypothetical protein